MSGGAAARAVVELTYVPPQHAVGDNHFVCPARHQGRRHGALFHECPDRGSGSRGRADRSLVCMTLMTRPSGSSSHGALWSGWMISSWATQTGQEATCDRRWMGARGRNTRHNWFLASLAVQGRIYSILGEIDFSLFIVASTDCFRFPE